MFSLTYCKQSAIQYSVLIAIAICLFNTINIQLNFWETIVVFWEEKPLKILAYKLLSFHIRESVIDINSRALSDNRLDSVGSMGDPDYKNLQYKEDGRLEMDPEVDLATSSFNDQIKILGNIVTGGVLPTHDYENTRPAKSKPSVPGAHADGLDMDYMNDTAEGSEHIYSNQDDLLLQVRETVL